MAWKSVAQLQQVPTRNFLIRIINLPASYLTTSPGIFQNMKSRRKPYIPTPPSRPSKERPPTPAQLLHQASAAAWPTSWCFVVAAKKEKLLVLPPFSFFISVSFSFFMPRFPVGKCVFGSAVQPSLLACLALAYNLCWLHLTANEQQ